MRNADVGFGPPTYHFSPGGKEQLAAESIERAGGYYHDLPAESHRSAVYAPVMPALPWVERQAIEADTEYVVMASRLPLSSYRFIPGFLRDTTRIRRQLASTDGLVGYALNAQLTRKTFWTFSVWTDRHSLDAFAAAEPHRGIMQRLRPRMGETRFEFLTMAGSDIPTDWKQRMAPVS